MNTPDTPTLQAAILPMGAGWRWIARGHQLFWRQPAAILFWSVFTTLLINLSVFIPILGQLALLTATPLLTFVTLCLCRKLEREEHIRPADWLAPLRTTPSIVPPMLRLGLLYLVCTLAAATVAVLPFFTELHEAIGLMSQPAPASAADLEAINHAMMRPLMLFGALYVVLSALFWHTPALVGWHRLALRRALFYSMVACWRNKWAIVLYAASWAALIFGLHWAVGALTHGLSGALRGLVSLPVDLILTALLYCSFYPIYTSIFEAPDADGRPGDSADAPHP